MLTDLWKPDPRLDNDPRALPPRPMRRAEPAPPCSCGCKSVHEVARRKMDGGVLVVRSDGAFRLFVDGDMGVDTEVWFDRFSDEARKVIDWCTVMGVDWARSELCKLAWAS